MVHQLGMLVAKRGIDEIDIPSPTNFPPEGFRHGATLRSEPRTTRTAILLHRGDAQTSKAMDLERACDILPGLLCSEVAGFP